MTERTCSEDGCEREHRARGYCANHWRIHFGNRKAVDVACPTCGEVSTKRDDGKATRRFCSLTCRDVWRIDTGNNPAPKTRGQKRVSRLPADHPVRVLIRERAISKTPLRLALEAEDWQRVAMLLRAEVVEVDGCWLWPRTHGAKAYGRVTIGKRNFAVHRLSKAASVGGLIPSHTPVHHTCAEPLCINPDHLQLVTPQQNVAEMLERRYYIQRIAELETALAEVAPSHPLIAPRDISPAT